MVLAFLAWQELEAWQSTRPPWHQDAALETYIRRIFTANIALAENHYHYHRKRCGDYALYS